MNNLWSSGSAYEKYMGRWSTLVGEEFLSWFAIGPQRSWVDVGCGTGVLTRLILKTQQPEKIIALDSSREFIDHARGSITDPKVRFKVGLAQSLGLAPNSFDAVVSGLVLNFVPKPEAAIREMVRITRPGGKIGIFLWDYSKGMQMLRYFWDAVVALNPNALEFDEGYKFPLCQAGQLEALVHKAGLRQVDATEIKVTTRFQDFEDYWVPFLSGIGPAPAYVTGLAQADRQKLEDKIRASLPIAADGSISLVARAWAVTSLVEKG